MRLDTLAYCTITDVKSRLPEIVTTDYDTELTALVEEADAEIDNALQSYESSLPLSPVPTLIKHASANIAAGLWRERRAPDAEQTVSIKKVGKEQLEDYINEKYQNRVLEA